MIKSIKTLSVFLIATFYVLQLVFIFSGALIENIQEIRYQNQVSKTEFSEKVFSLNQWRHIENKREIIINGSFYDVISFKIIGKKVIVNAVEDSFENEFRVYFHNLLLKKNNHGPDKKKQFNSYNYLTVICKEDTIDLDFFLASYLRADQSHSVGKTNKTVVTVYKPPC